MSSLFRDLNRTASAFCSTKNELLVVMALSSQTLGYGKISDPLTDKRLAKITGIRLDRLRPAVNAVVKKGLFDRKPHKRFGYEYSIGEDFLQEYQYKVNAPTIPQSGEASDFQNPLFRNTDDLTQMGQPLPEKRTHTKTKIKTKKTSPQSQQQTETKTETKKTDLLNSPQQTTVPLAEQQAVKLFFNDENDIPSSFAIETSSANTRIEFSFGTSTIRKTETPKTETHTGETAITLPEKQNTPLESPTVSTPKTTTTLKKLMEVVKTEAKKIEQADAALPKIAATTAKPFPINDIPPEKREPWMEDALAAANSLDRKKENIPLPKVIGEENYNACQRHFDRLDTALQKKLVLVFNYNLKMRTINNPAGYFITLAQTTLNEGLTVPPGAIAKQPRAPAQIAAEKEKADYIERWSDFAWLKQNAALQNKAIDELAKQMGGEIEQAYKMFAHTLIDSNG